MCTITHTLLGAALVNLRRLSTGALVAQFDQATRSKVA